MTDKAIPKYSAMNEAQRAHSRVRGQGSSWFFMTPTDLGNPEGPMHEIRVSSYKQAVQQRVRRVAQMALVLMGWSEPDAERAIDDAPDAPMDIAARVNRALQKRAQSDSTT